ncbi:hypothetical protein ANME2D_03144 [Candidatus Methanoperedens nitroreducens]|uniref:DUF8060 domain-containing protein n=1 Tax=Candidatus Methanoperedens nitratireducens TaxID=1392998 RepID=A0A062V151_9EURY|nr:hypothetical protein [Candidatus Methanoperedens nitroreducens]KCZ71112.1 hypothetical protein ANME2D_03144 [Candidatus Methanoperedens nitroreducens]MDJ1421513.1 hypothetical protein [Candidatus Methanoperedens sp.]
MVHREKIEDYFYLGIFIIAMLFALIATVRLYTSIDELIRIWFDYRYRPIFQALFSLSVLAISIYLIRERLIKR